MALDYFHCYRESNELGSDEICWALSGGSDTAATKSSVTREYGGVNTGSTRRFDDGTLLFEDTVNTFLCARIICWEADHSNSQWVRDLHGTMETISLVLFEMADKLEEYGGHYPVPEYDKVMEYLLLSAASTGVIAKLIEAFTNHDDLVRERTFVFDRAALGQWIDQVGDPSRVSTSTAAAGAITYSR
ncbi:hypothetical protein [Streptomyces sp. NPDC048638]|uniref:hypothetical protein n=1 Tax=Streptomyces sp. NPDC048638 TaxID=3365580 RepID=UPI00371B5D62